MWNHYLNFAQTNYKRWYQYFLSGTSEYQEFFTGLEVVCSQIKLLLDAQKFCLPLGNSMYIDMSDPIYSC